MIIQLLRRWIRRAGGSLGVRVLRTLLGALVLNLFFGVLFYLAESGVQQDLTLEDSIWWSMVTMTTVGYGDYYPQTFVGRFFVGYPCFLIGIGLIGFLLGTLADSLIDFTSRKRKGLIKIRMKQHIIICHCPSENKVLQIVDEIKASPEHCDAPVVVVAANLDERPDSFRERNILFVKGEPTNEETLIRANVQEAQGVFILAKDPASVSSDACTFAIGTMIEHIEEETGNPIHTVAEMLSSRSRRMVRRSSIDSIVVSEGITDRVMVQEFLHPGIHNAFAQLLTNTEGSQLYVCPTAQKGRRLIDIQCAALQYKDHLQVIGLIRGGDAMLNPDKQVAVEEGDMLVVLAESKKQFTEFENVCLAESTSA
ncbi:hypothetical protein Rhal01_02988 [Rubritalea halochordaticola]|uniref:Potassium channel protein n=1 Tax=Rubritalea halochordaticola TaxID=714537 RepID=A0ABP9V293_9BACT